MCAGPGGIVKYLWSNCKRWFCNSAYVYGYVNAKYCILFIFSGVKKRNVNINVVSSD